MGLWMPGAQMEAVLRHGEATYPHECCGLLLGHPAADARAPRRVVEAHAMRNANASSPRNRFDFDPKEHLAAQRQARERGLEIIGFYHSHPDHPARPSQYDLDHAAWPGYSYLIVSIMEGRAARGEAAARSFELAEDRSHFIQETVETTGTAGSAPESA
ncbi:MAG TPA: M67 family metallopeptidase [Terriglobales bacterium]|nr:M67 family metallopeptidase [Terriglobales bacterium]